MQGSEGAPPAQAVVLVALVVALGLVDALVGLLPVAPAAVVRNFTPGVRVPCCMPAQPAERLRRQCSQIFSANAFVRESGSTPRSHCIS